ncbi:unannotated protein [freshwater metagenome]|uniref:Unannotated protein n=1 Tax=freshwater metagenome TaxID=449393 RepID=A0A6J7IPV6_9ZZZZ
MAGAGSVSVGRGGDSTALTVALAGSEPRIYFGGNCQGNFIIDRNVTVIGGLRANGSRSKEGTAILDGHGSGTVIAVTSGTVALSRLTMRNDYTYGGGGIHNVGNLHLLA